MNQGGAARAGGGKDGRSAAPGYLLPFGTKAETLETIRALDTTLSIPDFVYFTCAEWAADADAVLDRVLGHFAATPGPLAVRSSSRAEDGGEASLAGAFHSVLNVEAAASALRDAIATVIRSFDDAADNQVLVQAMVTDVDISGVIMTHSVDDGAPYYVINYDDVTGQTDQVTAGMGAHKSVYIHRAAAEARLTSPRLRASLRLAREVEGICGAVPLDIEFAIDRQGRAHLFQVRRIATSRSWAGEVEPAVNSALPFIERFLAERTQPRAPVLGQRTLFTNMSDWNPAEIIGSTPRALAVSLYRDLVTRSVWREARAMMGYRAVPGEELMVLLAGQPFIDVRSSLNSFLPAFVSADIGARLVDAQVERLSDHPEFHDKLEFAVAQTAYDFTTPDDLAARYGDALDAGQRDEVANSLRALTNGCLDQGMTGTLSRAEQAIAVLARRQDDRAAMPTDDPFRVLGHVAALIEEARDFGTRPFAVLARHAFIAEALLRSAVARGALAEDRVQAFKRSFRTVAGDMMVDLSALAPDAFMARYGHIRPGTYDILSHRYDDRPDIFDAHGVPSLPDPEPFDLDAGEAEDLDRLIVEAGLIGVDGAGLFDYARRAIVGREYGKFVFTRNLSDALEGLAAWGEMMDMSRDDVSYLALPTILDQTMVPVLSRADRYFRELAQRGREDWSLTRTVKLNYIIRDAGDLHVAPLHRAVPNFIGAKHAEGPVVVLDAADSQPPDLAGAIVCIENADPGFDWIFARDIAGLVTKFGGTNSHMAIRCAEFDLPAVIGCGEVLFGDLVRARRVELSCAHKSIRPV